MTSNNVVQFYRTVIDDVINNVRETFLDDGIDEQVLLELKQVWESKITQSKALPSENESASRETEGSSSSAADTASKSSGNTSRATVVASAVSTTPASTVSTAASASVTSTVVNSVGGSSGVQYHYTTAGGQGDDVAKTVTITLPSQTSAPGQKPVTITLPAHLMQNPQAGGIIMSASAAAAAQALPAGIAAGLLQSQLTRVITQQQPDGTTVSYQAVTAEQLAKQGYVLNMSAPRPTITPVTPAIAPQPQPPASSSSSTSQAGGIIQLDGANDTSDDDDDDDDLRDDDNDPDDDDDKIDENEGVEEEVDSDPLNSEDDVSDEDPSELFDTDNVIVCQYDKITRSRNKWKFHLKDGIMNLQGKDYIFQKAIGDAEW